ncbi:unnamed protein product [Acanthoscelides obtectus]|uniref:Uncharacterized protein n=1 Tax=Acanthoscelides obtectus TaxID=200917 RepID=A0A9P0LYJ3_ACAOB|nr:unnamed protein product [Acanthoscelides obtectus]CAK1629476.1 hypothetical protein AOBTE_LOCUS5765 [Acanthoscelides obtectus]
MKIYRVFLLNILRSRSFSVLDQRKKFKKELDRLDIRDHKAYLTFFCRLSNLKILYQIALFGSAYPNQQ